MGRFISDLHPELLSERVKGRELMWFKPCRGIFVVVQLLSRV